MPHTPLPDITDREPIHVTVRVVHAVSALRTPKAYRAIRRALLTVIRHHGDFRIVHVSIQTDQIHLLCEADATSAAFREWRERTLDYLALPARYEPPVTSAAQSWLLTVGYKRVPAISVFGVP
jgi:REP element-mobilizing transposase RayT